MNSGQSLHPSQVPDLGVQVLRVACRFSMRSDINVVEKVSATMGTYSSTSSACFLPDLQDKARLMLRKGYRKLKNSIFPYITAIMQNNSYTRSDITHRTFKEF